MCHRSVRTMIELHTIILASDFPFASLRHKRHNIGVLIVKIIFSLYRWKFRRNWNWYRKKLCYREKSPLCRQIRAFLRRFDCNHTIFPVFTYMVLFLTAQLLRGGLTPRKFLFSSYGAPNVPKRKREVFLGGVFRRAPNIWLNWYIFITNRLVLDQH